MTEDRSRKSRLIIAYADLAAAKKMMVDETARVKLLEGKLTPTDIKTAKAKAKDIKR